MGFFSKKKQPEPVVNTESIEVREKRLSDELAAVQAEQDKVKVELSKAELAAVVGPPKEKPIKGEDVVIHCRSKGWVEKADWKANGVPMVELTKKLIQVTKAYVDARMEVIKLELDLERKGE